MTSPIAAVTSRVARLRAAVGAPPAAGFRGALARATAPAEPTAGRAGTPAPTPVLPAAPTLVGILGTPVRRGPGVAGAPTAWAAGLPERGRRWAGLIEQAAGDAGIDPRLLAAVVWNESSFRAGAVSRSGAIGLAQLMPGTAAELGVDPADPAANLAGGARYLRRMIDRFGSLDLAVAAYNAGPGRVSREGRSLSSLSGPDGYVPRVFDFYRRLGGAP